MFSHHVVDAEWGLTVQISITRSVAGVAGGAGGAGGADTVTSTTQEEVSAAAQNAEED